MINEYENDLIFGLDIGTRTVIGTIGYMKEGIFTILESICLEHEERAMLDGQIHDIQKVAHIVQKVRTTLENRMGKKLTEVAVAAAGRVLHTHIVEVQEMFEELQEVTPQDIQNLQLMGINEAKIYLEETKKIKEKDAFCVGHTIIHYYLDDYIISNLEGHKGLKIGAKILATFLPQGVIDSLYAVTERVGLEIINLTLEPIAAINAIIPENLRLLNLALVDVGAGTSDIAITREGSVVAYGMIPIAGDEVTEAIIHKYLVDFNTAERIKQEINEKESVYFEDILGFSYELASEEIKECIAFIITQLAGEVAKKILELNGEKPTNAVFCVGGGSQMTDFTSKLAKGLELGEQRVAVRTSEQIPHIVCKCELKQGPEMITPIGICLTTALNREAQFTTVTLNGKEVSLLNAKKLTVLDVLLQEGVGHTQIFPERGKTLMFKLNGERMRIKGTTGTVATLLVNGMPATIETPITSYDTLTLIPAIGGEEGEAYLETYLEDMETWKIQVEAEKITLPIVRVNGECKDKGYKIKNQDEVDIIMPRTLEDLLTLIHKEKKEAVFMVNFNRVERDYLLQNEDIILIQALDEKSIDKKEKLGQEETSSQEEKLNEEKLNEETSNRLTVLTKEDEIKNKLIVIVNNEPVVLSTEKAPYMFANIFDYINFDLSKPQGTIQLLLNGKRAAVTDLLADGDLLEIYWQK